MSPSYALHQLGIPGGGKEGSHCFLPNDLDGHDLVPLASSGDSYFDFMKKESPAGSDPSSPGLQPSGGPIPSNAALCYLQQHNLKLPRTSGTTQRLRSCTEPLKPYWLTNNNGTGRYHPYYSRSQPIGFQGSSQRLEDYARGADVTDNVKYTSRTQTFNDPIILASAGVGSSMMPFVEFPSISPWSTSTMSANAPALSACDMSVIPGEGSFPPALMTPISTSPDSETPTSIETPVEFRHHDEGNLVTPWPSYGSSFQGFDTTDTIDTFNLNYPTGIPSGYLADSIPVRKVAKPAVIEASTNRRQMKAEFLCEFGCGQTFTARHNRAYHHKSHQNIRDQKCRNVGCGALFVTRSDCKRHETKCKANLKITIPTSATLNL